MSRFTGLRLSHSGQLLSLESGDSGTAFFLGGLWSCGPWTTSWFIEVVPEAFLGEIVEAVGGAVSGAVPHIGGGFLRADFPLALHPSRIFHFPGKV